MNGFDISLLKNAYLFSTLKSSELLEISSKFSIRQFKKHEIILHQEKKSEFMYVILEGDVKVLQYTETGKEIIVSVHQAGDFFGELSLIDGKNTPATVCATSNSTIAMISGPDFYQLLYSQKKILDKLLMILCSRFRESMKKIQLLNFSNATQRVKLLLLLLADTYGEQTPKGTLLKIKLIHQDIADMTGMTRETVTRVLDKCRRNGEIRILEEKFILLCHEFETISF